MPDCRKELTLESIYIPAGAVIIGENCHIVAEKDNGPRGYHPLSVSDRNRYPNLILLCNNHHKMVDTDVTSWPVEKLHQIKNEHELWVKTTFNQATSTTFVVYNYLVTAASNSLMLGTWDTVSDDALRHIARKEWIDGIYSFNATMRHAILPGTYPALEDSLNELSCRAYSYAEHYLTLAWLPNPDWPFYQEDKTWKKTWRNDYDEYANRSESWQRKNHLLLNNMTHAINEFSDCVRAFLDPSFFLVRGRFSICDSMGVTNMLQPCWILPRNYLDVAE